MYKWTYQSPIGELIMVSDESHLVGLWFQDQKYVGGNFVLDTIETKLTKMNASVVSWLDLYFSGKQPNPNDIPLNPKVTEFRKHVLDELIKVNYGTVTTYKDIHESLNLDRDTNIGSARAIGGAVGHNPIAIIIPCHRVVGSDGSLTGYAGGLERKKELLRLEGIQI